MVMECTPLGTVDSYAHPSKKKRSKRKMGTAKNTKNYTKLYLKFQHKPAKKNLAEEEVYALFRSGWKELLDKSFRMVRFIEGADIKGAKRHYGLLHVYVTAPDEERLLAAEGVAWKCERLSARVCEGCGGIGIRRVNLKTPINFCSDCFTIYLDEQDDPLSLFLPGKSGLFNDD